MENDNKDNYRNFSGGADDMSHEEMMKQIKKWHDVMSRLDAQVAHLIALFGSENELIDAIRKLQLEYTELASQSVGDNDGWLDWYWCDNKMGYAEKASWLDGGLKKIKTLDDIFEVINFRISEEPTK